MSKIHPVHYSTTLTPENLDGTSVEIQVPAAIDGTTVTRTIEEGDVVLDVRVESDDDFPDLYVALRKVVGGVPLLTDDQPEPGDLIVSMTSQDDVPYMAGSIGVIDIHGKLTPAQFGFLPGFQPPGS